MDDRTSYMDGCGVCAGMHGAPLEHVESLGDGEKHPNDVGDRFLSPPPV